MAPRANWKGFLKLSLVSCSVGLVQATSSTERVRFNLINRETGNRIRYRQIDAETGEDVPEEDRIKGFNAARLGNIFPGFGVYLPVPYAVTGPTIDDIKAGSLPVRGSLNQSDAAGDQ